MNREWCRLAAEAMGRRIVFDALLDSLPDAVQLFSPGPPGLLQHLLEKGNRDARR